MDSTVGFIGTGNMGSALIRGILKSGTVGAEKIYAFDTDNKKLDAICEETGINKTKSPSDLVFKSFVTILAVKPNMVEDVLKECREQFTEGKLLVSIAAGVSLKTLENAVGSKSKIIRTMPNTPAQVGEGVTIMSPNENVSAYEINKVKKIFENVGRVGLLSEDMMPAVTALSGSSPAYVFMLIDAMAEGAEKLGINRESAVKFGAQAVLGAAKVVLETGENPDDLKAKVCSPGGTTIEAVKVLEEKGFKEAIVEAMLQCAKKAKEMEKGSN